MADRLSGASQPRLTQPDQYAARLDLANLLILGHQYSEAKQQLDVLAQKEPDNPAVYIALSNYYAGTGDTSAALADMRTALQKDPSRSDSYLTLAMLQMRGQQWDAAEANFKQSVNFSPKSMNALLSLGNFYQSRGRFPEAEQLFRRAIASAPDDPSPRLSLASLFMAENKSGEAEEFLRQSKKDFPNNSIGYRMLGDFYYANNQLDKATDEYANLYHDHEKDMVVKKNYIQLLILKDRLDEARKLNDEVLKAKPDDEDAQIYKGEIEIRSGKPSDAINTLQPVLKNNPDNGVAHYQQGLAYDELGNTNRAEQEWRDAIRRVLTSSKPTARWRALPSIAAIHPVWRRKPTRSLPCNQTLLTDTSCAASPRSIANSTRLPTNISTSRLKEILVIPPPMCN